MTKNLIESVMMGSKQQEKYTRMSEMCPLFSSFAWYYLSHTPQKRRQDAQVNKTSGHEIYTLLKVLNRLRPNKYRKCFSNTLNVIYEFVAEGTMCRQELMNRSVRAVEFTVHSPKHQKCM
jgi:hypothetical protein